MHDGQAVRVDRTASLLGYEVIHHSQEAGGQEEAHGVVAVPPLDHRIGRTRVDRVGFEPAYRHFQVVDDMQHRRDQDESTVEPVAHIDMRGFALHDRAEEHHGIADPYKCDQDVDRPLELSIFLGTGEALRQRDYRENDDRLPTPEHERRETVREQAGLRGPLHHIK